MSGVIRQAKVGGLSDASLSLTGAQSHLRWRHRAFQNIIRLRVIQYDIIIGQKQTKVNTQLRSRESVKVDGADSYDGLLKENL